MLLRRAQLRKRLACEAALAQVGMTLPQWGMLYTVATEPDSSTHALALCRTSPLNPSRSATLGYTRDQLSAVFDERRRTA